MIHIRSSAVILSVVLVWATAVAGAAPASQNLGVQDDTINCAYPFWPGFAPVHLALQLGYFAEEGLTVTETFDDDRAHVMSALESGEIQCDMRPIGEHQGRPRTPQTQGTIIGTIDV